MAYAIKHRGQTETASGLDVLAGVWLLISPFVLAFGSSHTAATANNVVLGIVIGLLALYRFFSPDKGVGVSWINVLLGIWVLISPWVVRFSAFQTATVNNVITGIIVILLAGWSALATGSSAQGPDGGRTMPRA
ncbi:MAG TPA: SPW repeat protein [Tepidisphaeraceae bacterium]|jgi:hypothetical protein